MYSIIFVIHDCGFIARCSQELDNATVNRIDKICRIIKECKYAVHDISRTELNSKKLPRFNMPLELGLFLGCKKFGNGNNRHKNCIVLDREKYRYQQYISDISGIDVHSHKNRIKDLIINIRNWIQTDTKILYLPLPDVIYRRYKKFEKQLPKIQSALMKGVSKKFTFLDYRICLVEWLKQNPY